MTDKKEDKSGKRRFRALIIIILLLLLLFLLLNKIAADRSREAKEFKKQQFALAVEKAQQKAKAISDSVARADSLKNLQPQEEKEELPRPPAPKPSVSAPSSSSAEPLPPEPELPPADSTPPVFSILPPSGRYYNSINLRVECAEPKCSSEISVGDSLNSVASPLQNYNKSGVVYFRATDSAGNAGSWQAASYEIVKDNQCAENSYPVPVKGKTVCVDVYEYPNKYGEKPRNMVSQSAAVELCESAGKHLCSIEEWQAACRGKQNSNYPYGNRYDQTKCVTDNKTAKEPLRSGFAEHCRSHFGMYDMSGNLWEWTSSPAPRSGLFLVAGGTWNSKNESGCQDTKFSFYPQNEYPFVGFRCCK